MPREPTTLGPHPTATAIVAADLNDDGTPDIVVSWTRSDGQGRYLQILIARARGRRLHRRDVVAPTAEAEPTRADRRDQAGRSRRRWGRRSRDSASERRSRRADVSQHRSRRPAIAARLVQQAAGGEYAMVDHMGDGKRDLLVVRPHPAGDPQERSVVVPDTGRSLVPAAVPDLTGVSSGGVIHLSWQYLWGASSYRVYRSTRAFGPLGPDQDGAHHVIARPPARTADTCGTTRLRRATETASAGPAPRWEQAARSG